MDDDNFVVLNAGEIEQYVLSLRPSKIEDLGTEGWLEIHGYIQKLSQQAVLEASEHREEVVKEMMAVHSKLNVLVHEAFCVSVWREKVLPELLHIEEKLKDTFLLYMVLFHEATAIALLETVLFYTDSCEALGEAALDLLDFCISALVRLSVGFKEAGDVLLMDSSESVKEQETIIAFNVGIRCISVLQYLIENLESLPYSVTSRMYTHHDVPLLLTHLMEQRPWERENPKQRGQKLKYTDGRWVEADGEDSLKLTRTEGQAWIALRQLLLNGRCIQNYEFSEFRRSQLQKVLRYLTDPLLDQLSPLIDLKHFLCQLQISSNPTSSRKPLILEMVPEIRQSLLDSGAGRWRKIAKKQAKILFHRDQNQMQKMAMCLSHTYDLNVLERLSGDAPKCACCGDLGAKRCSRCKVEWYCGRECQVKHWPSHKQLCNTVTESEAV